MTLFVIGSRIDFDDRGTSIAKKRLADAGRHCVSAADVVSGGESDEIAMRTVLTSLVGWFDADDCDFDYDGIALADGWHESYDSKLLLLVAERCGIPFNTVDGWIGGES